MTLLYTFVDNLSNGREERGMEQIDWLDDCYEEEHTDWNNQYEAMTEKEDEKWSDNLDE